MSNLRRLFFQATDVLKELGLLLTLSLPTMQVREVRRASAPVVVALTSYPPRIGSAWRAIETLLRQSMRPQSLVLVLAKEEFPDQRVPRRIRLQERRGLEILWVDKNGRSFDKLLPLLERYPEASIITCDDDKYFPSDLVSSLVSAQIGHPGAIIGARGWSMRFARDGQSINYGDNWRRAHAGETGLHLFLPGGNGALYPPGSLDKGVSDLGRAVALCPTADDIWFWGHAQKARTPMVCLGMRPHRAVKLVSQSPALSDVNITANQNQFDNVMRELNLEVTVKNAVKKALSIPPEKAKVSRTLQANEGG